jgi:hypothetical protein
LEYESVVMKVRKSTKPAGNTQKNILSVSWRLFEKYGYDNTTYQMIADEIGITKATITYYFKSKVWILYHNFVNYANSLREHITVSLTDDFNHYLYLCILTISFFRGIMNSEFAVSMFNLQEFVDLHSVEWIHFFELDFKNITEDFHKDFSEEEIYLTSLLCTGSRIMIVREFLRTKNLSVEQCCFYLAYSPGILSRLDEATIMKNISRALDFLEGHDLSGIILGA